MVVVVVRTAACGPPRPSVEALQAAPGGGGREAGGPSPAPPRSRGPHGSNATLSPHLAAAKTVGKGRQCCPGYFVYVSLFLSSATAAATLNPNGHRTIHRGARTHAFSPFAHSFRLEIEVVKRANRGETDVIPVSPFSRAKHPARKKLRPAILRCTRLYHLGAKYVTLQWQCHCVYAIH